MERYSTIEDLKLLSESALESSLAGFWDWNMATNDEYLSPRFKQMLGYAEHEMENKPESWQKIAFPEDLPGMFASFEQHVQSKGKVPFESIVRYHHKSGKTIWVRCNGKVVEWSDEDAPLRAIGCHIDISEEK
jgi:PAS domain S-box-containing protein